MIGLRILVVEQDLTIGPLLAEMLEDLGAVVCGVEVDPGKAADAAARGLPDLMIVDVGLGAANDVGAIKEILLDGLVPCVFVTDANLRESTLWPGAVLVRKPFRGPEIVAAIGRAIGESARGIAAAPPLVGR